MYRGSTDNESMFAHIVSVCIHLPQTTGRGGRVHCKQEF